MDNSPFLAAPIKWLDSMSLEPVNGDDSENSELTQNLNSAHESEAFTRRRSEGAQCFKLDLFSRPRKWKFRGTTTCAHMRRLGCWKKPARIKSTSRLNSEKRGTPRVGKNNLFFVELSGHDTLIIIMNVQLDCRWTKQTLFIGYRRTESLMLDVSEKCYCKRKKHNWDTRQEYPPIDVLYNTPV